MTEAKTDGGRTMPVCPFDLAQLEASRSRFFAHRTWKHLYDAAPDGAKARLDVSFWFTCNNEWLDGQPFAERNKYIGWREGVESVMTREDLEYMVKMIVKKASREHYEALLKERFGESQSRKPRASHEPKLMSYDNFFRMLDAHGEFKSYNYNDNIKKSIIDKFIPVLEGSRDPLATHLEDILATAKLKEVRVYPKDEVMYVRVEIQFLTATAEWSHPYQMLAAWDCFNELKGYAFPIGKGRRTQLPYEMEDPPTATQRNKRRLLKAERLAK